jgi:argininosuccinate lyase
MSEKMWGGRFAMPTDRLMEELNASITFDQKLWLEDITGSKAHAKMLASVGILIKEDETAIQNGLDKILEEIESGTFEFKISDEDIHMSIEKRLTELVGDAGKRLHTARSRNDQVALDFRMYCQKNSKIIIAQLKTLIKTLVEIAKEHTKTLMPGMTHLQHAQPISFAYHLLAYCAMFERDLSRFSDAYNRHNLCPLGSAALAGTPHPIDRFLTAKELGFNAPTINAMDSVASRDFALDLLYNSATLGVNLSRLAEEMIIWSSSEFGWITLSDAFATGSSIMPQKKNPDAAELIRGKSGRLTGNLVSLIVTVKGLPLAYNKDLQEDKEPVFDSVENIEAMLAILPPMLKTATIKTDNMLKACKIGHLTATDLADSLVKKGVPFRETHHIAGRAVALAESKKVDLSELSLDELKTIDERIDSEVIAALSHLASMNARKSYGGTSEESVLNQIKYFEKII